MTRLWFPRRRGSDDEGVALITVLGIVAVVSALAVTVATLSVHNLRNATRDRQANSALATSEAGVAEAITWLRSGAALGSLTCVDPGPTGTPSGACLTNPAGWTSSTNPQTVAIDGTVGTCTPGQTCYKVWVGTVTAYNPPVQKFGVYRIHSVGNQGNGPAARSVVVEVKVKPQPFPMGVFANTTNGSGTAGVHRESVYSFSCLSQRSVDGSSGGLAFSGNVDLASNRPPSAHSISHISTMTNCGNTANNPNQGYIHKAAPCNTNFPYDQSGDGGTFSAGSPCAATWTSPVDGTTWTPTTSKYTMDDLVATGYRPRGLSDAIYTNLKTRAQTAGTYFDSTNYSTSPYAALNALGGAQAVLYYKLPAGTRVTLGPNDFPSAYWRYESDTTCTNSNLIIVVEGGDLRFNTFGAGNSNPQGLVASIFVPDGTYDGNGNVWIIGTIYANQLTLGGTQDFRLDQCFVKNPPSALLDVHVQGFWEDDSRNL